MNDFLQQAHAIKSEIIENRRAIHRFAEIEFELPQTTEYVVRKLTEYGLEPQMVGTSGVTCLIGKGDKTILLRADMDALPMRETSGLPFAAANGNCHACGHDTHTAMLLGAAKLLKANEESLAGQVKLMFQPAEEILAGGRDMIGNGILEHPKVDAAMAIHIVAGIEDADCGMIYYKDAAVTNSGDAIRITVKGVEAHGASPSLGVDAIQIAAQIVVALQNIVSKEIAISDQAVVLVGKIAGGTAVNTVADTAVLDVSVRTISNETRQFIKERIADIAGSVAKTFRGEAKTECIYGMPPLINDVELCKELSGYCKDLLGKEKVHQITKFTATEDFCMIAERVPAVLLTLGAGSPKEGCRQALHQASLVVNEEALPIGTAVYAHCAKQWLKDHC